MNIIIDKQLKTIILAALISIITLISVRVFFIDKPADQQIINRAAISKMHLAMQVIKDYCLSNGIKLESENDLAGTFLIGPEQTILTTTPGHLDAKRTTTNPQIAGLIANLLIEAGIEKSDRVGIGSSGSFPGLMIASVAAVEALGARPVILLSIGSSSFGATREQFNLINIYELLAEKAVFKYKPLAYSLGGIRDVGREFPADFRNELISKLQNRDIQFIYEPDLRKNVYLRMKLLQPDSLAAFINCGGSAVNMGTSSKILYVKPGLVLNATLPPQAERGIIFEMISLQIPVIHLLFIQGLARKYGLIWDPIPLPDLDYTGLENINPTKRILYIALIIIYFGCLALLFIYRRSSSPGANRTLTL